MASMFGRVDFSESQPVLFLVLFFMHSAVVGGLYFILLHFFLTAPDCEFDKFRVDTHF